MLKFSGKLLFCILSLAPSFAFSQEKDWRPSAVRAGVDVYGLGRSALEGGYTRQEIQGDIDFYRYFAVVDLGREALEHATNAYGYNSRGTYYRLGLDVNLTPYNANRDVVFFGFRYAASTFNESLRFAYDVPYWGVEDVLSRNDGIKSRWIEAVAGIKVRVWQQLYMGYTIRAKLFNSIRGAGSLVPYEIPGYGLNNGGSNFGFGYHVYYRLAFRDKAIPLKPKN